MAPTTRDRMIDSTRRLLQEQGFHGMGVQQVVVDAAAPKGSIYHHFPGGKEQLAVEAIQRSGEDGRRVIEETLARARSAAAGIDAIVAGFEEQLVASGFVQGCPLATVALEVAPTSDPIATALTEAYGTWLEPLVDRLRTDGRSASDARTTATAVLALTEGALVLAKATRSTEPLRAARRAAARLLAG